MKLKAALTTVDENYMVFDDHKRLTTKRSQCDIVLPDISNVDVSNSVVIKRLQFKPDYAPVPSAGEINKGSGETPDDEDDQYDQPPPNKNPFMSNLRGPNTKMSFKNVVRAIIRARRWQIPLVTVKEEHSTEDLNKTWYEDQDTLHFNVNAFKAGSSGNAGLSKRARFILMKNAWERTEEELELIHTVVNQMKCFAKYSSMVRKELARALNFETFEDGRVIIQEGHFGFSMYFIVSGSVIVQVSQTDTRTGERKSHVVGEVPAGSSFGELALIQDCKRTATIVCKGTSQFLRVDKPDFDMVLRRSYEQEWQDRLKMLKSLPFFAKWDEFDLRHINLNCKVVEFLVDSTIVGDTSETPEHFHFIVSGLCKIIRKITIMETMSHLGKGQTMLSLPPPGDALRSVQSKSKQLSKRLLVIGYLERGDYFGIGENLESTYIVATTRVECLVIPRHAMVALERIFSMGRNDATKPITIKEMLYTANTRLLSEEESFEKWMTNLRWKNYKKKMMRDIIGRKPVRLPRRAKNSRNGKTRFNFNLRVKFSELGYPVAENSASPCPVYRRAGYQRRDQLRLPPIASEPDANEPEAEQAGVNGSSGKRRATQQPTKSNNFETRLKPLKMKKSPPSQVKVRSRFAGMPGKTKQSTAATLC